MTRPMLVALLIAASPAGAAEGRLNRLPAATGCAAPAVLEAAGPRPVETDAEVLPPFRLALLSCPAEAAGPPKRPLRRT